MKNVSLILLLVLMLSPATVSAQKKSVTIKKSVLTKKAGTKPGSSKSTTNTAKTHIFEGVLLYRNYEHHSTMIRKFSNGQAYNGERSVRVTLRGNAAHIIDEDMHVHIIILPDADKLYMYSDVSRLGFVAKASVLLPKFFSSYAPDVKQVEGMEKISTLKTRNNQETYKGDRCKVYQGQIKIEESYLTDIEMWFSGRLMANKSYRYVFNGLPVPGIVRRGIITQTGKIPLLGNVKSMVASELVALTERRVASSEMIPPANITIMPYEKDTQLASFYKQSSKALKKAKLYPEKMKTKEVDYVIRGQWDFADEWLAKQYGTVSKDMSWQRLGENLFSSASAVTSLVGQTKATSTINEIAETVGAATQISGTDETGNVPSWIRASGKSNSQVKSLERRMEDLNKRYIDLNRQYAAIGASSKVISSQTDINFTRQKNIENTTTKKGRASVQAIRPGQGLGKKTEATIKDSRQARAEKKLTSRNQEPVALEIAQVAGQMAQLEEDIYNARVDGKLFDDVNQRISSARAAVKNMGNLTKNFDKLKRVSTGSNEMQVATEESRIYRLTRAMNDEIRRLQGMSEEEIRNINAELRERLNTLREEHHKDTRRRFTKMSHQTYKLHNIYMNYLSELKSMEDGTKPYDKKRAREMQKWMKEVADRYEKNTEESYPNRSTQWENWTPFGK